MAEQHLENIELRVLKYSLLAHLWCHLVGLLTQWVQSVVAQPPGLVGASDLPFLAEPPLSGRAPLPPACFSVM